MRTNFFQPRCRAWSGTGSSAPERQTLRWAQVFLLGALFNSGCSSYSVKPDSQPVARPAKLAAPIPASVGIFDPEQRTFSRDVYPEVEILRKQLDAAGLFEHVYYPVIPSDSLDARLQAHIVIQGKTHASEIPKVLLSALTLGVTEVLYYHYEYWSGTCTVTVIHADKPLKTYSSTASLDFRYKLWNPQVVLEPEHAVGSVTDAIEKRLVPRMVEQLVNDRDFLAETLGPTK